MRVVVTSEPGGTAIGAAIRGVLLSEAHGAMDALTELLLYNADRRQHIAEMIAPALESGAHVICDRFSDSTVAYQGAGRGLDMHVLMELDRIATGGMRPDLTLLLDLDVREGLERNRRHGKRDRLELEAVEFHERVRAGFHAIAQAEPGRVKVVDATPAFEQVHEALLREVLRLVEE
jgi:dTMP kinase